MNDIFNMRGQVQIFDNSGKVLLDKHNLITNIAKNKILNNMFASNADKMITSLVLVFGGTETPGADMSDISDYYEAGTSPDTTAISVTTPLNIIGDTIYNNDANISFKDTGVSVTYTGSSPLNANGVGGYFIDDDNRKVVVYAAIKYSENKEDALTNLSLATNTMPWTSLSFNLGILEADETYVIKYSLYM